MLTLGELLLSALRLEVVPVLLANRGFGGYQGNRRVGGHDHGGLPIYWSGCTRSERDRRRDYGDFDHGGPSKFQVDEDNLARQGYGRP